jgi:hypothetical protein
MTPTENRARQWIGFVGMGRLDVDGLAALVARLEADVEKARSFIADERAEFRCRVVAGLAFDRPADAALFDEMIGQLDRTLDDVHRAARGEQ